MYITKTRPCNILQYFTAEIMIIFIRKNCDIFSEAVLSSTHYQCFGAKVRKNVYPCKPQFYCIKVGSKGVFGTRTCFRDVSNYRPVGILSIVSKLLEKSISTQLNYFFIN